MYNTTATAGSDEETYEDSKISVTFEYKQIFQRAYPDDAQTATVNQLRLMNPEDEHDVIALSEFASIFFQDCDDTDTIESYNYIAIETAFEDKIVLTDASVAEAISVTDGEDEHDETKRQLIIEYACVDQWAVGTVTDGIPSSDLPLYSTPEEQADFYNENGTEPEFTVFSQLTSIGFLQGYSIMTFYTGIVVLMGSMFRPILMSYTCRAFVFEATYPDPILRLCESVHLARYQRDLMGEEQNYRLLQEILRSPELLKSLTGSCLKGTKEDKDAYWAPEDK